MGLHSLGRPNGLAVVVHELPHGGIRSNTLGQMLSDEDAAKSGRVMNAMLQMGRLDLKRLQQAYNGE